MAPAASQSKDSSTTTSAKTSSSTLPTSLTAAQSTSLLKTNPNQVLEALLAQQAASAALPPPVTTPAVNSALTTTSTTTQTTATPTVSKDRKAFDDAWGSFLAGWKPILQCRDEQQKITDNNAINRLAFRALSYTADRDVNGPVQIKNSDGSTNEYYLRDLDPKDPRTEKTPQVTANTINERQKLLDDPANYQKVIDNIRSAEKFKNQAIPHCDPKILSKFLNPMIDKDKPK